MVHHIRSQWRSLAGLLCVLMPQFSSAFPFEQLVASINVPETSAAAPFGWTSTCCTDGEKDGITGGKSAAAMLMCTQDGISMPPDGGCTDKEQNGITGGKSAAAMLMCTKDGISMPPDGGYYCLSNTYAKNARDNIVTASFSLPVSAVGAENGLRVQFETASSQTPGMRSETASTYRVVCGLRELRPYLFQGKGKGEGKGKATAFPGDLAFPVPPYNWSTTSSGDLQSGCASGTNVTVQLRFVLGYAESLAFDGVEIYREAAPLSDAPTGAPSTEAPSTEAPSTMSTTLAPTSTPTPPWDPPELNSTTEVVIEGLAFDAFPDRLQPAFFAQFVVFTLLYALLVHPAPRANTTGAPSSLSFTTT